MVTKSIYCKASSCCSTLLRGAISVGGHGPQNGSASAPLAPPSKRLWEHGPPVGYQSRGRSSSRPARAAEASRRKSSRATPVSCFCRRLLPLTEHMNVSPQRDRHSSQSKWLFLAKNSTPSRIPFVLSFHLLGVLHDVCTGRVLSSALLARLSPFSLAYVSSVAFETRLCSQAVYSFAAGATTRDSFRHHA
jgi:hypothetical protein